jgi:hypothetical protein
VGQEIFSSPKMFMLALGSLNQLGNGHLWVKRLEFDAIH